MAWVGCSASRCSASPRTGTLFDDAEDVDAPVEMDPPIIADLGHMGEMAVDPDAPGAGIQFECARIEIHLVDGPCCVSELHDITSGEVPPQGQEGVVWTATSTLTLHGHRPAGQAKLFGRSRDEHRLF